MDTPTRFLAPLALAIGLAGCPIGWNPEAAQKTFPLVGLHEPLACTSCHPSDQPDLVLSALCASCHEAKRPAGHYAGDCSECHTEFGWDDVVVDHTFFPLTHSHSLPCDSCHTTGVYTGLDPACDTCHAPPASHFAGACAGCHSPTSWDDAEFDHDEYFPLPHREISDCAACHPGEDYEATPACTSCHTHSKERTDSQHFGEVSDYQYTDEACLRCHPNGRAED